MVVSANINGRIIFFYVDELKLYARSYEELEGILRTDNISNDIFMAFGFR